MSKRGTLESMMLAGYHDDRSRFTRLYIEGRVKQQDASAAWAEGVKRKQEGMACSCPRCKRDT